MAFDIDNFQRAIRQAETVEDIKSFIREEEATRRIDGIFPVDEILSRQFGRLKNINLYGNRYQDEALAYRFYNFLVTILTPEKSDAHIKALRFCRENGIVTKAMSESANVDGGALVPPEFDNMIIRLVEANGVFRANAKSRPMTSDMKTRPRRTGGVTTAWLVEGGSITASQTSYDNVNLSAKKLAALVIETSELSEDSALSIADEIAGEIGIGFALAEDQAGFIGDGSPTYGNCIGITTKLLGLSGTIANIAGLKVATGNAMSEFVLQDFLDTAALLPAYADNRNTAWYVHRSVYFSTMLRCALIGATNLAVGGVVSIEPTTGRPVFLGYPVNFTQVMPKTDANSQIAALLGDLSLACTLGDRRRRSIFVDPYSLGASDRIQIRGIERVDLVANDVGNADASAANRAPGPVVGLISAAS